jgi:hypothetical protein
MLKRIVILAFVLSALALLALAPMNETSISIKDPGSQNKAQVTVVVATPAAEATPVPGVIPVTGNGGVPMTTMLVLGLLAILAFAVVIGGFALISRNTGNKGP